MVLFAAPESVCKAVGRKTKFLFQKHHSVGQIAAFEALQLRYLFDKPINLIRAPFIRTFQREFSDVKNIDQPGNGAAANGHQIVEPIRFLYRVFPNNVGNISRVVCLRIDDRRELFTETRFTGERLILQKACVISYGYGNYVLGTYNDGITQMLVSVIGGIPMGIGIFAVWPLAKKFGKRNVTMVGFILYATGSLICWLFSHQLVIVLIGQFIKNIGGLPCAYVFMALFADCLDHLEWKKDLRMDGAAMSIYNIIAVAMVGIMTGVFNWMLAKAGYIAPIIANSAADAASKLTANGWTAQLPLDQLKPAADGVLTVAMQQPNKVSWVISFAFVGLEVFTGIALVVILFFLNVEKELPAKQAEIKARHENRETEAQDESK